MRIRLYHFPCVYHIQLMQPTFSLQSTLPRLPVPSLQDSLSLYLSSIRPFQTPTEHENSKAVIEDFRTSCLAESLQQRLIDIDRRSPQHWLSDYWLKKGTWKKKTKKTGYSNGLGCSLSREAWAANGEQQLVCDRLGWSSPSKGALDTTYIPWPIFFTLSDPPCRNYGV
jgi:hypothetical protein